MAETVVRFIGALIQAALELLIQHTGKKVQVEPVHRIADWPGRLEHRRASFGRGYCSTRRKTITMPISLFTVFVAAIEICGEVVLRAGRLEP